MPSKFPLLPLFNHICEREERGDLTNMQVHIRMSNENWQTGSSLFSPAPQDPRLIAFVKSIKYSPNLFMLPISSYQLQHC